MGFFQALCATLNSRMVRVVHIGQNFEDLIEAGNFKDRPEIFLHGREQKFAAILLGILHSVHQNGQTGTIEVSHLGKIDNYSPGFFGNNRAEGCCDLHREMEIYFTVKDQYLCCRHSIRPRDD